MTLVAYIRVSTIGQSLEVQRDKVLAFGVEPEHIYEEKRSGVDNNRPALEQALRYVRKGDLFIVTKIDRLARSAADLLKIVSDLRRKGVEFRVLDQQIDTSTPAGNAMLQMLAVFAEFETEIRKERQMDGIAKAKAKGTKFGRKAQITPEVAAKIREMRDEGLLIGEIMKKTDLSKASVYRALNAQEPIEPKFAFYTRGYEEDEEV